MKSQLAKRRSSAEPSFPPLPDSSRIEKARVKVHIFRVSLARLFAMMIAVSLLFAPLAMDRAMAATSHSQMAGDPHCQPDDGSMDQAMAKQPCCTAMCATAMVLPEATPGEPVLSPLPAVAALASIHRAILSEIATPPPRAA